MTITWLNLDTGERGEYARGLGAAFAREIVDQLRYERAAARDENTGRYPPIIHGIRRNDPAVNPQ